MVDAWQWLDDDIATASYQTKNGQSRTTILRCQANHYLIYSPGAELAESAKQLIPAGARIDLIAPSTAHVTGLSSWRQSFPHANLWGSDPVCIRFASRLGLARSGAIGMLHDETPPHIHIKPVPFSELGETWIWVDDPTPVLLTCDSLMNIEALAEKRLVRWQQKLLGIRQGICISNSFKRGVSLGGFRNWASEQMKTRPKFRLVPCHGVPDMVTAEQINHYINQRFQG